MAKNSVRDFDATAANNTDIQSVDIAENCAPSGINNAIRELMADIKNVSTGTIALESPSADSLTVTGDLTVDTNTLYVDSTNNRVGVGTVSPAVRLDITPSGAGAFGELFRVKGTNTGFGQNASMRVIGGNSDSTGLLIQQLGSGSSSGAIASIYNEQNSHLRFGTNNTERMRIDSSGNVGIGTSSPAELLNLAAGSPVLRFTDTGDNNYHNLFSVSDDFYISADRNNTGSGNLIFRNGGTSERMRIQSTGVVQVISKVMMGILGTSYQSGERDIFEGFAGGATHFSKMSVRNVADTSDVFKIRVGGNDKIIFTAAGNGYWDGAADNGAADYAEYFEWDDGNTNDEDRVGYPVVLTNGNKIRKATSSDATADIIGIVSGRPAFVGDSASLGWAGKWQTDDYARRIKSDVSYYEWTDSEDEKHAYRADELPSDVTVPSDATTTIRQEDTISTSYDSSQTYTPRSERQEWDAVGMMGKLRMRAGQPTGDRWIKMRDIATDDDGNVTVEEWLIR